ncbi:TRAP transporter small permease [Mesobaculum littorinae]|uniref:TRAP transporter small permease protein n=2 Tax=Mesobaculum littorinae TaxID=2486419 RepID=A0A438AG11_9RHOB|nr:TRAP transporter small permease [Mesobaculum littorinae]
MNGGHLLRRSERVVSGASTALAWIGGACLIAIVGVVAAGVIMRYGFQSPILGVNEIVQSAAVILVTMALPYCTARGDHVNVDVFDRLLGRWGRLAGDALARLVSIVVLVVLSYRAALKALDAAEWGDATNMLALPLWPFHAALALGAGVSALIYALELLALPRRGKVE